MPQPYNYMLDVPDPTKTMSEGIATGFALSSAFEKRDIERQQREKNLLLQEQMRTDLAGIYDDASPKAVSTFMLKYPDMAVKLKEPLAMLNEEQQKSKVGQLSNVYMALNSGNVDVAKNIIKEQAEAAKNAGNTQDAQSAQLMLDMLDQGETGARMARSSIGLMLAGTVGPEKFAETYGKFQEEGRKEDMAPAQLTEQQAKAQKAAVEARFAESQAVIDIQKKGADIEKLYADMDIAKQNAKIAAINAQTARETNDLKRKELQQKLDKAVNERDEKVRTKWAEVEQANSSVSNLLGTIERLRKNPELRDVIGSYEGDDHWWTFRGDDEKDAIALIEQLSSQQFNAAIKQLGSMSGLTEVEGKALTAAAGNLTRKQSEEQFLKQLEIMEANAKKMADSVAKKYGVPTGQMQVLQQPVEGANATDIPPPMPTGFTLLRRRPQ